MGYEQNAIQYLNNLCINGTFISGNITGINESIQTAEAIVVVLLNNDVSKKVIIMYMDTNGFNWKYLNELDPTVTKYPHNLNDWEYPTLAKRIIAPMALVLQYPQFEVWFRLNGLPIVIKNETLYCYCNEILPEHQALADSLQGIITIENNPNI